MPTEVYLGGGLTAIVMTLKEKEKAYRVTPEQLDKMLKPIQIPEVAQQIKERWREAQQPSLLSRLYYRLASIF